MTTVDEQKKLVKELCRNFKSSIPWEPISKSQRQTDPDSPARGDIWISRTKFQAPKEDDLRRALYNVCERLKTSEHSLTPPSDVPLQDVGVEFLGRRLGVGAQAKEPHIPEEDKLKALENECRSDMTILYMHGGGLWSGSPAQYRAASARLARMTGARVASIRYRLSPKHTFPSPILDALVAYASLIHPAPGAHHKPVPANRIVLTGNSAGAQLCLALTKVLLELRRSGKDIGPSNPYLTFHGQENPLPLPAGIAICSGWHDQSQALPSWFSNAPNDIFLDLQPALHPGFPTDDIWPSKPPRETLYCAASVLDHELVSPAAVSDWTGAPPMWFACGSGERTIDSNKMVASQAARCGVSVAWTEYAGMPHEFVLMLGKLPQAIHCFRAWAEACSGFARGSGIGSRAVVLQMPDCKELDIGNVKDLSQLSLEEVRRRMRKAKLEIPVWKGDQPAKAMI